MNIRSVLVVFGFLLFSVAFGQITVVMQPDADAGKDALLANCIPCGYLNTNYGDSEDFASAGWTHSGAESDLRALIDFDLSQIPQEVTVLSATLSLYHNPDSQNGDHASLIGSNESIIQRVTSIWGENTVTWASQPSSTNQNEVYVPQSTTSDQDYLDIDVTNLVRDMLETPTLSHGFLFKSINEDPYKRLIFASSDHPKRKLHPKLKIVYSDAVIKIDTCQLYQPGRSLGQDAVLNSLFGDNVNPNHPDLYAVSWTNAGQPVNGRSLLKFDLSSIPYNAVLTSSDLSLYGQVSPLNGGHSNLSGSNQVFIQRVTSNWSEGSVSWNNQPTTSAQHQVLLPATTSEDQDYIDINVLEMTQDMLSSPTSNHGFLIKLATEAYYRKMVFASSDHPDSRKHPKLKVCYSYIATLVTDPKEINFSIFPNPSSTNMTIISEHADEYDLSIFDARGRLVLQSSFTSMFTIDVSSFSKGVYFVRLSNGVDLASKKMMID